MPVCEKALRLTLHCNTGDWTDAGRTGRYLGHTQRLRLYSCDWDSGLSAKNCGLAKHATWAFCFFVCTEMHFHAMNTLGSVQQSQGT